MNKEWDSKINMNLEHRAIEVFKSALLLLKKKVERSLDTERQLGWNNFLELHDYIEHLERRIESALTESDYEFTIGETKLTNELNDKEN